VEGDCSRGHCGGWRRQRIRDGAFNKRVALSRSKRGLRDCCILKFRPAPLDEPILRDLHDGSPLRFAQLPRHCIGPGRQRVRVTLGMRLWQLRVRDDQIFFEPATTRSSRFSTAEQSTGAELDQRRIQSAIRAHHHRHVHQPSRRDESLMLSRLALLGPRVSDAIQERVNSKQLDQFRRRHHRDQHHHDRVGQRFMQSLHLFLACIRTRNPPLTSPRKRTDRTRRNTALLLLGGVGGGLVR
jgi:hypothetical protein